MGELVGVLAGVSFFGMPWVAWWVSSRRKHRIELKKLEVERERELTRRRYMELDYELRQRQITEKLFDQTADDFADGRSGLPPAQQPPQAPSRPSEASRQMPPGQRPAG
jgi:hypothetical protein